MFLDLNDFIKSMQAQLPIAFDIDLSEIDPAFKHVRMEGVCKNTVGVFLFKAEITGDYDTVCDRCADDVTLHLTATVDTVITPESSEDDSVLISGGRVDLTRTAYDALVLALPGKILCNEDCKGLCYTCGKNLNRETCDCE